MISGYIGLQIPKRGAGEQIFRSLLFRKGQHMEKILYLDNKGKHTTDASKAAHGEIKDRKELRGGRFSIASDGIDIL